MFAGDGQTAAGMWSGNDAEELPPALVVELKSYKLTLDGLHLEAIDGFADVDGLLNLLPTPTSHRRTIQESQP
jgi:hypothetical protein